MCKHNPAMLGVRARTARKRRGLSLADMVEVLRELDVDTTPASLSRMEDGSRPGDPRTWGGIWRVLDLPLYELYEGLGLPVPDGELRGIPAEILTAVQSMPADAQRAALVLIRYTPQAVAAAKATKLAEEPVPRLRHSAAKARAKRTE